MLNVLFKNKKKKGITEELYIVFTMHYNEEELSTTTIEEIKLVKRNFVLQIQLIGKINLRKQIQAKIFGNWIIKLKGRSKTIV